MDGLSHLCAASLSSLSQPTSPDPPTPAFAAAQEDGRPPGGRRQGNPSNFSAPDRTTVSDPTTRFLIEINCILFPRRKLRQGRDGFLIEMGGVFVL